MKSIISPSTKYRLEIQEIGTKPGCWNYTRGLVYRVCDGSLIADITRKYSTFHHSFVMKNNEEYLITGNHYLTQTVINLDTGEIFENNNPTNQFCWASHYLSPDGNTLVVEGCFWAAPYEYKFFDFTDPSKGWPELKVTNFSHVYPNENGSPEFLDGNIICSITTRRFKPTGKYEDEEWTFEELDRWETQYDDDSNWEVIEKSRVILTRAENEMRIVI